jgi:hypothetical protein
VFDFRSPKASAAARWAVVVSLGAASVTGLLSACGGSSARGAPDFPLAIRKLDEVQTGFVRTQLVLNALGVSVPPIVYVTRFDNVHKRTETTIDLRRFIRLYDQTIPAANRVGKAVDWRFDVIADSLHDLVLYVASPLFQEATFQAKLPASARGKRWMKLDFVEALIGGIGPTSQLVDYLPGSGSPLGYFTALSTRASFRRVETVDSAKTNRYGEVVNFRRHLAELPPFLRKLIARSSPTMRALIWVDRSSTVRRIRLTSRPIRGSQGLVMIDTTDLSQLGGKITIDLPPAHQVFDASALGTG